MKALLNKTQQKLSEKLEIEVPYFLEYTREIVSQVISGKLDITEMNRQASYAYDIAKGASENRDFVYTSGALGRLAMYDEPNDIQYFEGEREKCIEILMGFGIT